MDGVLVDTVRRLRLLNHEEIAEVLANESSNLEITKSLLNILFNICFTRAVPLTRRQRALFKDYDKLAVELLTGARKQSAALRDKKRLLQRNPALVKLIAETCPLPAR